MARQPERPLLTDTVLATRIAAIAHDCWRRAAQARSGGQQSPIGNSRRRSPAARVGVAFSRLPAQERELVRLAIASLDIPHVLAQAADVPRGPSRPLCLRELRRGLRVAPAEHVGIDIPGLTENSVGIILDWSRRPGSCFPAEIRVGWPGGIVTRHQPLDADLRRIGPPLGPCAPRARSRRASASPSPGRTPRTRSARVA